MAAAVSGAQAVERAARIVELVVEAQAPLTTTQIATELGLAMSTASRILSALETGRLLESNPLGYVAGPLFWLYAARHDPWEEVARLAHPVMERAAQETLETVHLGVVRNGEVVHVAQIDTEYLLGAQDWGSRQVPPHASALGKVIYAYEGLPVPTRRLERLTERTITRRATLEQQLEQVRTQGYASTVDELELGLTAIAAPLLDLGSRAFGALGVSGPTSRLAGRVEEVGRLLVDEAEELNQLLRRRTTSKEGAA